MSNDKVIVLTAYGHGEQIDRLAVNLFDSSSEFGSEDAETYCQTLNELELKDDNWIVAKIAEKNFQYPADELLKPEKLTNLLPRLDDRAIQLMLQEVEGNDLAIALKGVDANIQEMFFRNMSERAAAMLKEDMEYMGPLREKDRDERQQKIVKIIKHLEDNGNIVIPRSGEVVL
jgi:flagellar motor switch protein FliG